MRDLTDIKDDVSPSDVGGASSLGTLNTGEKFALP